MGKKRGRPKKDETYEHMFNVRLNSDDMRKLEYASKMSGVSKADIVRDGIRMKFNYIHTINTDYE